MRDDIDEIWALYADDGGQSLDAVESALARLRADCGDSDAIGLLFRSMHTFKGNSRILGLTVIETLAHTAEDLIGLVRDEGVPLDEVLQELLIEATDVLRRMMEATLRTRQDASSDTEHDLVVRMKNKLAHYRGAHTAPTPSAEVAVAEVPVTIRAPSEGVVNRGEADFTEALVFGPVTDRLAEDLVYRQIFLEMARVSLDTMADAISASSALGEVETTLLEQVAGIIDAAERIGMADWTEAARKAVAGLEARDDAAAIVSIFERLYEASIQNDLAQLTDSHSATADHPGDLPMDAASSAKGEVWYPADVVDALTALLASFATGEEEQVATLGDAGSPLCRVQAWAKREGIVAITDGCMQVAWTQPGSDERAVALFALGSAIARTPPDGNAAQQALGAWAAGRAPTMLVRLAATANHPTSVDWSMVVQCLMEFGAASRHFEWSTATEVTLLLTDVCARVRDGELTSDRVLTCLLASFVEGARAMIEARARDRNFNVGPIESLLEHAARVAGSICGDPQQVSIESILDLPPSFHGIMSADSSRTASAALEAGLHFFIIRADIERDAAIAERFFAWLASPSISNIASFTIFEKDATKFDFLVAAAATASDVRNALMTIDPDGHSVTLAACVGRKSPVPRSDVASAAAAADSDRAFQFFEIGETLGELAVSHATTRQTIESYIDADLPGSVDFVLRNCQGNLTAARDAIAQLMECWQDRLVQVAQTQMQVAAEFERLQGMVAHTHRRPAAELLEQIRTWAISASLAGGTAVEIITSGHDVDLETRIVGPLEQVLRQLVEHCITRSVDNSASEKNREIPIKIAASRDYDGLQVTVIDDRPSAENASKTYSNVTLIRSEDFSLSAAAKIVRALGAELSMRKSVIGGRHFVIELPVASNVLDGLIVGVGAIRYVLPVRAIQRIVSSRQADIISILAENGGRMLRLDNDELLPIHSLEPRAHGDGADASARSEAQEICGDSGIASASRLFVIAGTSVGNMAVAVDELLGQQSVFVKPLSGYLAGIRAIAGSALLKSGDVGMVLDVGALSRRAHPC